jgi:alpha-tubulin suppressor-like RCC1 family protein
VRDHRLLLPGAAMIRTDRSATLCAALLLLVAACKGSSEPAPVPTRLAFTVAPVDVRTQATFATAPVVEVRDATGARVTGSNVAVTVRLMGGAAGASLRGSSTVTAVNGVATFAGLSVDSAGTGYTLAASATGLAEATSSPFAVVRGTPRLAFRTQPVSGEAGLALTTQPIVEIRDSVTGGILANRADTVSVALATNSGSVVLSGTARVAAVAGVATFTNLVVPAAGTGYVLAATSTGMTPASSAAFDVAPIQRTLTIVSGNTQVGFIGRAVAQPIRVRVTRTAGGTPLAGQAVTFEPRNGGAVSVASPVTDASGEAQTVWTLGPTVGAQTAVASFGSASPSVTFTGTAIDSVGLIATQVVAGGGFGCAMTEAVGAVCWGSNVFGQMGDTNIVSLTPRSLPVRVKGPVPLVRVTASSAGRLGTGGSSTEPGTTTCGLSASGVAYCWGRNHRGQIGNGSVTNALLPVEVRGGRSYSQIVTGGENSCAVTTAGSAFCWGANFFGQVGSGAGGLPNSPNELEPVAVSGGHRFTQIVIGTRFTCALDSAGRAWCWGNNADGQLGNGTTANSNVPVAVQQPSGVEFGALAAGAFHTCGIDRLDGRLFCWGGNDRGQLGDGTLVTRRTPVAVGGSLRFRVVAAGSEHSCGITLAGDATCWGSNFRGQLGDDTQTNRSVPGTPVFGARQWTQLAGGEFNTCGIESVTSRVYCWGWGAEGALGNGTNSQSLIQTRPVPVSAPRP